MQSRPQLTKIKRKSLLAGSWLFALSVQYFLVQYVVSLRWFTPYSLAKNTISDLGNTACGVYNHRLVCSPWHNLMNASFIILAVSMIGGAWLLSRGIEKIAINRLSMAGIMIGGIGILLVGLFPENTVRALHEIGAALPFLVGNLGVLLFGYSPDAPKQLRIYSRILAVVGLTALVLYVPDVYLGLGEGGMERLVAYPQTIWMITVGVYYLDRSRRSR
jgi:hypothetical membrane protein